MVPRPKHEVARDHLGLARADIEAGDERGAVSALFYAAEALVALAEVHGIDTKRDHRRKADAASAMHANGALDSDFGPLFKELNQQRKDVWYAGQPPDFGEFGLSDVADEMESPVRAAEAAVGA